MAFMRAGLLVEEIDDLMAVAKAWIIATSFERTDVVVKREILDVAVQQQEAGLTCRDDVDPALRRLAIDEVVVEPDAEAFIGWDRAAERVNQRRTVCGDVGVAGAHSGEDWRS